MYVLHCVGRILTQWGRARALHDAYAGLAASSQSPGLIPLTTADVFTWLEEEGHFPRTVPRSRPLAGDKGKQAKDSKEEKVEERWCGVCGHGMEAHLGIGVRGVGKEGIGVSGAGDRDVKAESADGREMAVLGGEEVGGGWMCEVVPRELQMARMPMVDIKRLLTREASLSAYGAFPASQTHRNGTSATLAQWLVSVRRWRDRDLVTLSDPHFTIAVRNIVMALKLPSFRFLPANSLEHASELLPEFPLTQFGATRAQVDAHLAPHALLALLMKKMVQVLVEGGLEASRCNQELVFGLVGPQGDRHVKGAQGRGKEKEKSMKLLTPLHVMTGIVACRKEDKLQQAVFQCLARLGTTSISHKQIGS